MSDVESQMQDTGIFNEIGRGPQIMDHERMRALDDTYGTSPVMPMVRKYSQAILTERESTHGNYDVTARMSQNLKNWFREQPGWEALRGVQQESFDLIAVKLARILSGNPNEPDHWKDIAGYAELIVARL
jgi:hypothetical protein